MALRLLAGPFPVQSTLAHIPTNVPNLMWYPRVGLLAHVTANVGTVGVIGGLETYLSVLTLDGIFEFVNLGSAFSTVRYGWWPARHRLIRFEWPYNIESVLEPKVFVPTEVGPQFYAGTWFPNNYVRLADRRVYFYNHHVWAVTASVDAVESTETFLFQTAFVGPGRSDTEIFVVEDTSFLDTPTRCCFYNTLTKLISSPVYNLGVQAQNLVYAPEWDILISLHESPYELRIWSLETLPTTLTTPIALDDVKTGRIVTYQVQLTGDQEEPCPDQLVAWQVFGEGAPLTLQSKTDAEGFATLQVLYGLGGSGDTTIEASVAC